MRQSWGGERNFANPKTPSGCMGSLEGVGVRTPLSRGGRGDRRRRAEPRPISVRCISVSRENVGSEQSKGPITDQNCWKISFFFILKNKFKNAHFVLILALVFTGKTQKYATRFNSEGKDKKTFFCISSTVPRNIYEGSKPPLPTTSLPLPPTTKSKGFPYTPTPGDQGVVIG